MKIVDPRTVEVKSLLETLDHAEQSVPFSSWLAGQAEQIGHPATSRRRWLAAKVQELAVLARQTDSGDPATMDDRIDTMNYLSDQGLIGMGERRGFDDGFRTACREES